MSNPTIISFNGTGIKFLGYSALDEKEHCTATSWIVFLWFPIYPLRRYKLEMKAGDEGRMFAVIDQTPKENKEIVQTYLWGWLLVPLVVLGPLVTLAFLTETKVVNTDSGLFSKLLGTGLGWTVISILLLYHWDQRRGMPGLKSPLRKIMH